MEDSNNFECTRHEDLVAFLYGEMEQTEAYTFRRHLNECASCENELEAFGDVRQHVVAWRDESLRSLTPQTVALTHNVKPSAVAALREFFSLSPAWMKGATVVASLLFCLFAVLAVVRLREAPAPVVVISQPGNVRSEHEINALVERRVQEELQRQKSVANDISAQQSSLVNPISTRAPRTAVTAIDKARRPLTKVERQELAADLRLISDRNENEQEFLSDELNQ